MNSQKKQEGAGPVVPVPSTENRSASPTVSEAEQVATILSVTDDWL